ncbi:hypothetical protein A2U01_0107855, partial [Trifolium medium]|nr:hypothetical protein [Trifolium medium]
MASLRFNVRKKMKQ